MSLPYWKCRGNGCDELVGIDGAMCLGCGYKTAIRERDEARAEIEMLQFDGAALSVELEILRRERNALIADANHQRQTAVLMEAENTRLREALRTISTASTISLAQRIAKNVYAATAPEGDTKP